MAFVRVSPELVSATARDLAGVGSSVSAANAAALGATTDVVAAGQDPVSAGIAELFSDYGAQYQSLSVQAEAVQQGFVASLKTGAQGYEFAEADNVAEQSVWDVINAPATSLLGRPLIGDGADASVPGGRGGDGGILWGNGGKGAPGGSVNTTDAADETPGGEIGTSARTKKTKEEQSER
ncbi:PE family protein, partial [Mycobacterium simulans]|uniref:PE family protein n=1 Tax=Mycobacterium simulans TaxID=627089 RepID=UPI00163FC4BE